MGKARWLRFSAFASPGRRRSRRSGGDSAWNHPWWPDGPDAPHPDPQGAAVDLPALRPSGGEDRPGPDRWAPVNPSSSLSKSSLATTNRLEAWHTMGQRPAMPQRFSDAPMGRVSSGQELSRFRGQGGPPPGGGCALVPRPKCPQLQTKGTWGEAQAKDQGGSTLAAIMAQFLTAIDRDGRDRSDEGEDTGCREGACRGEPGCGGVGRGSGLRGSG